jgi:hypothetical protein
MVILSRSLSRASLILSFRCSRTATGRWAKKIRGKLHYFGPWSDPDGALTKYMDQRDALHAGRKPRVDPEALSVKGLANAFLNHKQALLDAGELSPRTWLNCKEATDFLIAGLGKQRSVADIGPDDFAALRNKMTKKWGPVRVRDFVQRIRNVFKFAFDVGLIATPMRFGPGFSRPSKKTIRLERARKGVLVQRLSNSPLYSNFPLNRGFFSERAPAPFDLARILSAIFSA